MRHNAWQGKQSGRYHKRHRVTYFKARSLSPRCFVQPELRSDASDLLWAAAAEGGLPSSQVGRPPGGRPTTIKEEGITNGRQEVRAC